VKRRKILVLTNHYPPYHIGGYEVACLDVVERLCKRGYDIQVLTSRYGPPNFQEDGQVRVLRKLSLWGESNGGKRRPSLGWFELRESVVLKKILAEFQPDWIYLWNMQRLAGSLVQMIQRQRIPVVFSLFGYWPLEETEYDAWVRHWMSPAQRQFSGLAKSLIRKFINHFLPLEQEKPPLEYVHFCSQSVMKYYKDKGITPRRSEVIYPGVDTQTFVPNPSSKNGGGLRLLYAGQIIPHKGIQTILEALEILIRRRTPQRINLTIVGPEVIPDYAKALKNFIREHHLESWVELKPQIPRQQLIPFYQSHDAFIFSSNYAEPFAIVVLEAMACGLPIIGTPVGGQVEIFRDGFNCLTFPANDAGALAHQIEHFCKNPELRLQLGREARKTVLERFGIENTIHQIERFLNAI